MLFVFLLFAFRRKRMNAADCFWRLRFSLNSLRPSITSVLGSVSSSFFADSRNPSRSQSSTLNSSREPFARAVPSTCLRPVRSQ